MWLFFRGSVIEPTTLPITLIFEWCQLPLVIGNVIVSINSQSQIDKLPISGELRGANPSAQRALARRGRMDHGYRLGRAGSGYAGAGLAAVSLILVHVVKLCPVVGGLFCVSDLVWRLLLTVMTSCWLNTFVVVFALDESVFCVGIKKAASVCFVKPGWMDTANFVRLTFSKTEGKKDTVLNKRWLLWAWTRAQTKSKNRFEFGLRI